MRVTEMVRLGLLAALLLVCGCSSNNKGKLAGTKWTSVASTVKGVPFPAGTLQLEFGSDGSLVYTDGGHLTSAFSTTQASVLQDLLRQSLR